MNKRHLPRQTKTGAHIYLEGGPYAGQTAFFRDKGGTFTFTANGMTGRYAGNGNWIPKPFELRVSR